jgi:hypothetical protein
VEGPDYWCNACGTVLLALMLALLAVIAIVILVSGLVDV